MPVSGTVIANIAAGQAHNAFGTLNDASTSTDNTVTFDSKAPTVTINQAATQLDPTNGTTIHFTVVFSETVTDFTTGDVTLTGTAAATTATVTGMTTSGTVIATVAAGKASDAAGNPSDGATTSDNTVTFDSKAPTVTINQAATQLDPTNGTTIHFTVIFSETVTDFTTGDVTLSGTAAATTATVTGSGTTYDVAVTDMTNSGTVIANIAAGKAHDAVGNASTASTSTDNSVTLDSQAPTVTINQASTQIDPTTASTIHFTVIFSETVTDFATGDVTLTGTAGATTATVTGSGTTYDVAVTGMTNSGTVIANIGAGKAHDAAGNSSAASSSSDNSVTFTAAAAAPTVTINQAAGQSDPASTGPIKFTVVFSTSVTGFTSSDISLANSTAGGTLVASVAGSGANYTVSVTGMTGNGVVIATVKAGAAVNAQNTASAASTSTDNSVTFTTQTPQATTLTITLIARQAAFKNEFGLYFVDDATGRIGSLRPGDSGYARAAIGRTKAVFTNSDKIGTKRTVNLPAGTFYGLYLVQNATRAEFLARNPLNRAGNKPLMFFSFAAANPDGFQHLSQPSAMHFAFEDQTGGGDRDFNDSIVEIRTQANAINVLLAPVPTAKKK